MTFRHWLGSLAFVATLVHGLAQEATFFTKERWSVQTTATATVPAPSAPFRVSFRGENLGLFGGTVELQLPSGTVKTTTRAGQDMVFGDSAASAASLNQTYGAGTYTLTIRAFGTTLSGSADLGTDAYPAPPRVLNFAAAQTWDAAADFTVQTTALANAGDSDYLHLTLRTASGTEVFSEYIYGGDPGEFYVAGETLAANQDYVVELAAVQVVDRQGEDDLKEFAVGFASVTTFALHTSGSGPTETTPPALRTVTPADGTVLTNTLIALTFQFSEPMDTSRMPLTLTATRAGSPVSLDAAKLFTFWEAAGDGLTVVYNASGGGWPAGTSIHWTLEGGPTGFRDLAGNPLATVSGGFNTTGNDTNAGGCDGASPVEAAGFGMFKLVNFRQTDAGAPGQDPTNGATFQAFLRVPDAPGRAALEFPADPAPKPHQLKFFAPIRAGLELFSEPFANAEALDAAYPAGQYDFQLRDRTTPTTELSHAVMTLTSAGAPPTPRFANFAAAQQVATNADFTLTWDAFTGADPALDALTLTLTDEDGTELLSLPDTCANRTLPVTATSAVVPRELLAAGKTYVATLTFFRLNDHGKTLSGTTAQGVAATGRATRMSLKASAGSVTAGERRFRRFASTAAGEFEVSLDCPVNVPLRLEAATALDSPFSILLLATNPPVSPLNVTLPAPPGAAGFLRARTTE